MHRCRPPLCSMASLSRRSCSCTSPLADSLLLLTADAGRSHGRTGLNSRNQALGPPAGRPLQQQPAPCHVLTLGSHLVTCPQDVSRPAAPPVSSEQLRVRLTFANKVTKPLGVTGAGCTERILHHFPLSPHALQTAAAPRRPPFCRRGGRAVISYQGIAGAR